MPGGDRTGPAGMGPMSGRGAGYCAGNNPVGCGRGRGRRYRVAGFDGADASANLQAASGQLEQAMKEIKDRMAKLESETKDK